MDKMKNLTLASGMQASEGLAELALNLRWSWNHATDKLWQQLNRQLWDQTQNPWVILQTISPEKIEHLSADPAFRRRVDDLLLEARKAMNSKAWFQKTHARSALSAVAYFSMEFMLTEALPIYSGGLGNVAGDQLKAASDLNVPVIGVGLLYGQGYFRQEINADGYQEALYPFNDPGQLPIRPLRRPDGEWLRLQIPFCDTRLWVRLWEVQVGRRKLYLLDANDAANTPSHRSITSELYGGGPELRLKQELVLGIAGWRLLRALGIKPEVCHLNEGHAAFAVLERARCYMEDNHTSFDLALTITRAGNLFTTHTAVEAGFDRFPPELIGKYLRAYAEEELGISLDDFLALGRKNSSDRSEPFNMAYLAIHGSGQITAVSKLHEKVSQHIFQPLFSRWPEAEVPIGHVTNGVHMPTWDSAAADTLWTTASGKSRWLDTLANMEQDVRRMNDSQLWQLRSEARELLIDRMRRRFSHQVAEEGASKPDVTAAEGVFDKDSLTLGFARRFATYKRPNLLLHDPERLVRILTDRQRPVQLILAGKAHPKDIPGQALIKQWTDYSKRPEVKARVIFLSDYDMMMSEELVQGVDVWINTPRRPWEASGTSGMKVLVNGGLNLSELDGWWAEAYSPEVGWAIGDCQEHGEDPEWDAVEADAMYALLEQQVIPEFYDRNDSGMPVRWLNRIRESMARLTPQFSANRVIREYTEDHYLPAATAVRNRAAAKGKSGASLLEWKHSIQQHWGEVRFQSVSVETHDNQHVFSVEVDLGEIAADAVRVELYVNSLDSASSAVETMTRNETAAVPSGDRKARFLYTASVGSSRPASDYTARIVPFNTTAHVPLEAAQILWEH